MAGDGRSVIAEVRRIMQDTDDTADPIIQEDTIRQNVNRQVAIVVGQLGLASAWITNAIALATNQLDYAFPGTAEYLQVLEVIYHTDQLPLRRISREEMQSGRAVAANSTGRQVGYALAPSTTQGVTLGLPGYPIRVEALDILVSLVPATWPIGPDDPPTIPFSERTLRALELLVAASIGMTLAVDRLTALDLNPKVFADWRAEAQELLHQERLTIIRLKRAKGTLNFEWFKGWIAWWPR